MAAESQKIAEHVLASSFFQRAERIGVYIHCAQLREVDTRPLLRALLSEGSQARCYVPLVEDKDSNMRLLHLESLDGLRKVLPFNILEPTTSYSDGAPREDVLHMAAPLQVLLMPGLAFDAAGRRCGRAGGYYDKLLARLLARAAACGCPPPLLVALAFEAQMLDSVPVEPHDRNVDVIITAHSVLRCSPRAHLELADEQKV
ncbi:hypothetical protein WJX81_005339 [Elliptochloris bilobata]|uniref:5-formyltetrahydrofolate cyclo-ligase n=1 Tax=Elliptochloris bilobata TaxID=381761 RepID=A0AAW1S5A2_9CHLO